MLAAPNEEQNVAMCKFLKSTGSEKPGRLQFSLDLNVTNRIDPEDREAFVKSLCRTAARQHNAEYREFALIAKRLGYLDSV